MKTSRHANGVRTWIEIDTRALVRNYRVFRKLIGKKCRMMAVVKSNAYGHGLFDFTCAVEKLGVDMLAVDSVIEAFALRKHDIKKPILVLGFTLSEHVKMAVAQKISITVSNFEHLRTLLKLKIAPRIHIKIDTGMHRQGFLLEDVPAVIRFLKQKLPRVKIEGLYSHLAGAKNPKDTVGTKKQIAEFEKARTLFFWAGFKPMCHLAATSGVLAYPKTHYDMVRIGIGLYGMWPSDALEKFYGKRIKLSPILSWKTIISEIKDLPRGSKIGYNGTTTLVRPSRVAVCPIGYWHGYPRTLSHKAEIIIHGKRVPVLGTVSMDMIVIDVTRVKGAKIGDAVTLIGREENVEITADELAELAGTINYEIVTRLNPLIQKVYYP